MSGTFPPLNPYFVGFWNILDLSPGIHSVDPNLWTVPMHVFQLGDVRIVRFLYLLQIRTGDDGVTGLLLDLLIRWSNINISLSVPMSNIL